MLWCHRMTVHFENKYPTQNTAEFLHKNPRQIPLKNPQTNLCTFYTSVPDQSWKCPRPVTNLSLTFPRHVPGMSWTFPWPAFDLAQTCPRPAPDLFQTCIRPASDLPWIFHRSVPDLYQFCPGSIPDLSWTDGHVKTPIRILYNCCKCQNPLNFL